MPTVKHILFIFIATFSLSTVLSEAVAKPIKTAKATAVERTICVYDPAGEKGDISGIIKKIAHNSSNDKLRLNVKAYKNDIVIRFKFNKGECDSVAILGLMVGQYNTFAATLDAFGVTRNYDQLSAMLTSLYKEGDDEVFINGDHEIAGIFPIGVSYMMSRNMRMSSVDSIKGRTMHVARASSGIDAKRDILGIKTKYGNNSNFAGQFNRGEVDLLIAPLAVVEAMGMSKAFKGKGGIIDHPMSLMTLHIVVNRKRYPEGFAKLSRIGSLNYLDAVVGAIKKYEISLEDKMLPVSRREERKWIKTLGLLRDRMVEQGIYDKRMVDAMKQFDLLQ